MIVIAWKTDDVEVVGTARVDLGERHKTRPIVVAKAVMWSRKDSDKDLASAEAYAKNPPTTTYPTYDYRVFVYPATERDPLERARRDVLRDPPKSVVTTPKPHRRSSRPSRPSKYEPGQVLYCAYPDEVVRVEYVHAGSDETVNYRVKPRESGSHTVRSALGQWTTTSSLLFSDPLAAATKAAQLAQALVDEDRR